MTDNDLAADFHAIDSGYVYDIATDALSERLDADEFKRILFERMTPEQKAAIQRGPDPTV